MVRRPLLAALACAAAVSPAGAQTRLLRQPTISATQVAFAYANNIWVTAATAATPAGSPASRARRRTPISRPTGAGSRSAASTAATATSTSCRSKGASPSGSPTHPDDEVVQGWTPDGKSVVFASSRHRANNGDELLDRSADGDAPAPCPCRAPSRAISPDGKRFAYRMTNSWDREWRNYRGGQNRAIWILDLASHEIESPPWTDSKDIDPVWIGDTVFFLSDRDGCTNIWSYDTRSKELDAGHPLQRLRHQVARGRRRHGRVRAGRPSHQLDPATGAQPVDITARGTFRG